MIEKLLLPFPLLSDPDRSRAIEPFGVADPNDKRNIARPATIIVGPDGAEHFRSVGRDFADRPVGEEVVEVVISLGLEPTTQESPILGPVEPGPNAFPLEHMLPYFRGARFASLAMGMRFPEAKEDSKAYVAQMDRYAEAAKALFVTRRAN